MMGLVTTIVAQTFHHLQHARQISSSDNSQILEGASALYANPVAAQHQTTLWDFSLTANNRFNTDIYSLSGAISYKANQSALGLLVGRYGISGFYESQISLSYSRSIGRSAFLGIQGHYYQLQIEGLGDTGFADFTLGYWQTFAEKVSVSLYVKNPLDGLNDRHRTVGKIDFGLVYNLSDILELYSSVSKPWGQKVSLRPGFRYKPHHIIYLYTSFNTAPSAMSFGAGISLPKNLMIDIGINTHPILGSSVAFSLGYQIE